MSPSMMSCSSDRSVAELVYLFEHGKARAAADDREHASSVRPSALGDLSKQRARRARIEACRRLVENREARFAPHGGYDPPPMAA